MCKARLGSQGIILNTKKKLKKRYTRHSNAQSLLSSELAPLLGGNVEDLETPPPLSAALYPLERLVFNKQVPPFLHATPPRSSSGRHGRPPACRLDQRPCPCPCWKSSKGSHPERKVHFFLTLFKSPLTPPPPFRLNIMWSIFLKEF